MKISCHAHIGPEKGVIDLPYQIANVPGPEVVNFLLNPVKFVIIVFFHKGDVIPEISDREIQTTALDHRGLVAVLCQDLKITQRIDDRFPYDSLRKVNPGTAVIAMILNGLGFTNRRL